MPHLILVEDQGRTFSQTAPAMDAVRCLRCPKLSSGFLVRRVKVHMKGTFGERKKCIHRLSPREGKEGGPEEERKGHQRD